MFVKEINSNELSQWLKEETPILLVDVRSPQEMAQASIPSGKPLPLSLLPLRVNEIPANKKVVFYCRSGARSAQACMFMTQQGYDNVYNLQGGIISWVRNGLSVEPIIV